MVLTMQHGLVRDRSSDAALITQSLRDAACFGALFDRHAAAIHRFAAARVGPTRAEDVVSEVFEIAFDRRASFDPGATTARPWLYGIAANRLKRLGEDERRWLRRSALAGSTGDDGADTEQLDARIDARRLAPGIARALLSLSAAERDVLLLHALDDLSAPEIAQALGIRHGAARTRLARARARLRAHLHPNDDRKEADRA